MAWFSILFTGRYPKAFFDFNSGIVRWQANVFAYIALLRDEYPPFSWEPGEYPLSLVIDRAQRQSRFRLFVRAFTIIPNQIVLQFVAVAWLFTTSIAWFAILFTGKYPRGLFKFAVGVMRWWARLTAYTYLLRDDTRRTASTRRHDPVTSGYRALSARRSSGRTWRFMRSR